MNFYCSLVSLNLMHRPSKMSSANSLIPTLQQGFIVIIISDSYTEKIETFLHFTKMCQRHEVEICYQAICTVAKGECSQACGDLGFSRIMPKC